LGAGQELPVEDLQRKRDLEERLPTLSQARKIDKHLDEKAKFLRRRGLLDPAQVRVLQKLHEYRNEAQHNDALRPGSLRPPSASTPTSSAPCCATCQRKGS
jgi:hypothetical protein